MEFDQTATHNEVLCFALSPQNPISPLPKYYPLPLQKSSSFQIFICIFKNNPHPPPPNQKQKHTHKIPLNFPKLTKKNPQLLLPQ
jgi:hypothetical protein